MQVQGTNTSSSEHIRGTTRVRQASKKITETQRLLNRYCHVTLRDDEHIGGPTVEYVEKGYII